MRRITLGLSCILAAALAATGAMAQEVVLKASHQFPGGRGDARDEMVQIIAREAANAKVGLKLEVYPGESLFKATEQWQAMVRGQLDISAFPLDYASGRHGEFSATLMPGLIKNHDHAKRINKSPFMGDIRAIMEKAGVVVLADAWLAGAFGSRKGCIRDPEDAKGLKFRSAGKAFAEIENTMTSDALRKQGMAIEKRENFEVANGKAVLLTARQQANTMAIRKWLLIASFGDITAMVSFETPNKPVAAYPETEIRAALASLAVRATVPVEEQLALVPFKVTELAGLFRRIWSLGEAGVEVPLSVRRNDETFQVRVRSADRRRVLKRPILH